MKLDDACRELENPGWCADCGRSSYAHYDNCPRINAAFAKNAAQLNALAPKRTAYEQVIEGLEARLNTAFQRIEQLERDVAKLKTYTRLPEAKWMCADCGTCFATTEHVVSHICEPQP